MATVEIILCIAFIGITTWLLVRKVNPATVLLLMGLAMLSIAAIMGISPAAVKETTGAAFFDIFKTVEEKFLSSITRLGFMIMSIGGYVALMNRMKATDAMVFIVTSPLSFLRGREYLASVIFIPLGMLLYLTIPSASGLGLLLVSTLYPILVNLGVSKPTALSVISAATIFDMGPGSANTIRAAELIGTDGIEYFLGNQLPLVIPTTLFVMAVYWVTNKWLDRKDIECGRQIYADATEASRPDVPLWFAIFPVLPLAFLIILSPSVDLTSIHVSTTLVMLLCTVLIAVFLIFHERSTKDSFETIKSFWDGLGSTFSSVVTLIVTAEVFAMGLTSLKFIDLLIGGAASVGMGAQAVTAVFTITVFFSAVMMGSGNAAFFSFGPMIPGIAGMFGVPVLSMILPIQLCAGMGRAVSPIAAVNVAISGAAGISPMDVARRNVIPMVSGVLFLMIANIVIN